MTYYLSLHEAVYSIYSKITENFLSKANNLANPGRRVICMYSTHMNSVFAFFSGVSPDWVGCPIQNHWQITGAEFYPSHQPTASKH